jgi:hypothetical protein
MSDAILVADRETVAAYVRELEARGFIHACRRGSSNLKAADRRGRRNLYEAGFEGAGAP